MIFTLLFFLLQVSGNCSLIKWEFPYKILFQLFWAKALEGLQAMVPVRVYDRLNVDDNEYIPQNLNLAGKMEPACSLLGNSASAATVCAAIHAHQSVDAILRNPITGQASTAKQFDANPAISTNVDQPFVQVVFIRCLQYENSI